jgi:hypothetical protein
MEDVKSDVEKCTTALYQAPEQIDLYSGYPINEKVDVWVFDEYKYFFRPWVVSLMHSCT